MNKIMETIRLILAPFTGQDSQVLHMIFTNAHIRKYLWDDQVIDQDQTMEILAKSEQFFSENEWGLWKVMGKVTTETIGFVGLWPFFGESQPQLIYGILPDFVSRGYGVESARKVLEYAFEKLKFEYLDAATDQPNQASQKVARKLHMNSYQEDMIDNKPTIFYRITAREYNHLKPMTDEFTQQS